MFNRVETHLMFEVPQIEGKKKDVGSFREISDLKQKLELEVSQMLGDSLYFSQWIAHEGGK